MSAPTPRSSPIGAALLAGVFLLLLIVLFAIVYLVLADHYLALVIMGVLSLMLGLGAYLAQAFSRDATVQRALGWGFGAMGFALLFGAIWVNPSNSMLTRLVGSFFVLLALLVAIGLTYWRLRTVAATEAREERRSDWGRRAPPSAFEYAAARAPGTTPGGSPGTNDPPRSGSP